MQLNCRRTNAIKCILHFFIMWKLLYVVVSNFCLQYYAATGQKSQYYFAKQSIACQHFVYLVLWCYTLLQLFLLYFPTTVLYLVRGWDPLSIKERGCQQGCISKIIIVLSLTLILYHHGHCWQRMFACKCKKVK